MVRERELEFPPQLLLVFLELRRRTVFGLGTTRGLTPFDHTQLFAPPRDEVPHAGLEKRRRRIGRLKLELVLLHQRIGLRLLRRHGDLIRNHGHEQRNHYDTHDTGVDGEEPTPGGARKHVTETHRGHGYEHVPEGVPKGLVRKNRFLSAEILDFDRGFDADGALEDADTVRGLHDEEAHDAGHELKWVLLQHDLHRERPVI
mmetsp:Transcript_14822/g.44669  ORF Transcript_14822/g.44669 Transcript_14822/m.44669 type:complete len:202 (-) Transcript_14822:1040-1645(-)